MNISKNIFKEKLIDSLYKISSSMSSRGLDPNISDNDYFQRRIAGFEPEIEFELEIQNKTKFNFIRGGTVFFPELDGTKNMQHQFTYVTIDSLESKEYSKIYKKLSSWKDIKDLFYLKLNLNNWEDEEYTVNQEKNGKLRLIKTKILKPNFKIYNYDRKLNIFKESDTNNFSQIFKNGRKKPEEATKFRLKEKERFNYLNKFEIEILKKLYAERYFLAKKYEECVFIPIDIDGFIYNEKKLLMVEIKGKSPITNNKADKIAWSYGWDTRRLIWYHFLQLKIGIEILYCIRNVYQKENNTFINWDSLYLNDFLKGVSWEKEIRGGGNSGTMIAPYSYFTDLKNILKDI